MKIKFGCLFLALFIAGCQKYDERDYSYDEISKYQIKWDNLLNIEDDFYSVYVYSEYCKHCQAVKNEVISTRLKYDCHLYFCVFSESIPLFDDVSKTIGENKLENIGILGTPSVISLVNHTVTNNGGGEKYVKEFLAVIKQ